jgi:hypothetical protein
MRKPVLGDDVRACQHRDPRPRRPMTRAQRLLWSTLGIASALWAGSWRIIYLEVTRWHHMDTHLRFTPPDAPGADPSPGLPVITAVIVAAAAPPTALIATLLLARMKRTTRPR